jgi:hypothetical protein
MSVSKFTFTLPKNAKHRPFGSRTPVIEIAQRRHNVRIAKITFYAVTLVVGALVAVVASTLTSTAHAVVIGIFTGLAVGVTLALLVLTWPVVRVLWHWTAEIGATGILMAGYLVLAELVVPWQAGLIVAVATGGLFALPFTRAHLMPWLWCAISRHRLRVCFTQVVKTNQHGTVPFILMARPTPAGERIWVWLRTGLALAQIEAHRDQIAVGCWAKDIRLSPASRRYAPLVRIDVTRRNPLTDTIDNPLPAQVDGPTLTAVPDLDTTPAALDLPDVPEETVINPDRPVFTTDTKPGTDKRAARTTRPPADTAADPGDDISDWI